MIAFSSAVVGIGKGSNLKRRDLLAFGISIAALRPLATWAQQQSLPRHIGFLLVGLSPDSKAADAFRLGLREAGYTEGRDFVIDWRSAQGDYNRVPDLVADLIQSKVDVMVMDSTVGTEVAKRSTSTVPIVMALVLDPVGSGLVESLARPGGNITGLSMMTSLDLSYKRLQLLKELIPELTRVAIVWNPDHRLHVRAVEEIKSSGSVLSLQLSFVPVRTPEQLDQAFSNIVGEKAQALYVIDDPIFFAHRAALLKLASVAGLPTIHDLRRWPEADALMSYGPDLHDLFRRSAGYVDRILKGGKPADLPVEQPIKFELVINLKTANALGLTVPHILLAQAHEVIE